MTWVRLEGWLEKSCLKDLQQSKISKFWFEKLSGNLLNQQEVVMKSTVCIYSKQQAWLAVKTSHETSCVNTDGRFILYHPAYFNIYIDKFNLLETQEVKTARTDQHATNSSNHHTEARDTPSLLASSILWYGALLLTGGVVIIAWPVVTDNIYSCIFMLMHLLSE